MPENKNITDYKVDVDHLAPKEFLRNIEEEQSIRDKFWFGVLTSFFTSLIAGASMLLTAVGFTTIKIFISEFGWFIGIVFIFQLSIVGVILIGRRRNRKIVEFRRHLVRAYLTAIDKSTLNPSPKGPMLVE